jgi:hypothetical protein
MLTTKCCLIIFLNISYINGPGPSSIQILIHAIISYVVLWKLQFTKTNHTQSENWISLQKQTTHNKRTETNINSSNQHQWRTLAAVMQNFISCWWLQTLLVYILKMFIRDCQSPRTTDLRDPEYGGVCYVVRNWSLFVLDRPHIICCRLHGKISNNFGLRSISTRYGCNLHVPIINISKYQKGIHCTGMKFDHHPAIRSLNHNIKLFKPNVKIGSPVSFLFCRRIYCNQKIHNYKYIK